MRLRTTANGMDLTSNMPLYLFQHIKTGEVHEVMYHMNDAKDYRGPKGKARVGAWKRVYLKPRAAFDSLPVDPFSSKDFARVTNKKGLVGDMWERSAEMSAKRAEKEGADPVKNRFYRQYSAKRKGHKHPLQAREEIVKGLKSAGLAVDFGDS